MRTGQHLRFDTRRPHEDAGRTGTAARCRHRHGYLGAESGSDQVLEMIDKGVTNAQNIEAVQKIEESGIKSSVTFISGLGGREMWEEHAVMTGKAISAMQPTYVGLLTLLLEPGAPMRDDVMSGKFQTAAARGSSCGDITAS